MFVNAAIPNRCGHGGHHSLIWSIALIDLTRCYCCCLCFVIIITITISPKRKSVADATKSRWLSAFLVALSFVPCKYTLFASSNTIYHCHLAVTPSQQVSVTVPPTLKCFEFQCWAVGKYCGSCIRLYANQPTSTKALNDDDIDNHQCDALQDSMGWFGTF